MHSNRRMSWTAVALAAIIALAGARTAAAASPDFNSVQWTPLGCPNADLIKHDSPGSVDFAGSSTAGNEPAYTDGVLYLHGHFVTFRTTYDNSTGEGTFVDARLKLILERHHQFNPLQ